MAPSPKRPPKTLQLSVTGGQMPTGRLVQGPVEQIFLDQTSEE